jgi:hypothetical protein
MLWLAIVDKRPYDQDRIRAQSKPQEGRIQDRPSYAFLLDGEPHRHAAAEELESTTELVECGRFGKRSQRRSLLHPVESRR